MHFPVKCCTGSMISENKLEVCVFLFLTLQEPILTFTLLNLNWPKNSVNFFIFNNPYKHKAHLIQKSISCSVLLYENNVEFIFQPLTNNLWLVANIYKCFYTIYAQILCHTLQLRNFSYQIKPISTHFIKKGRLQKKWKVACVTS